MKDIIQCICFLLIDGYLFGSTVVKLVLMIFRYFKIKELEGDPYMGIKVHNISYEAKTHIFGIVSDIVMAVAMNSGYQYVAAVAADSQYRVYRFIYGVEAKGIFLLVITMLLLAVMSLLLLLFGQYAYLTPEGIVYLDKMFKTDKYRYTVDYEQVGENEYNRCLNVYKKNKNEKNPYRFQLMEKEEKALIWVDSFK